MDSMTALTIANHIQQDRLANAARTRAPMKAPEPARPSYFGEMAQVLVLGFRQGPAPSR
jgi:hypothetical protein